MIGLRLTNRSDAIFAASPASTGGQSSLGHPSGAALWGVAAGNAYRSGAGDTFARVHSGMTRLSPAFPIVKGEPAFPWPQCLLEPKHSKSRTRADGRLHNDVWNTIHPGASTVPGEVLKGWYLSPSGYVVSTNSGERGKTAIRQGQRRAEQGNYFQNEHLKARQSWQAWVGGDGAREVAGSLVGSGLRLGRSGMQEYGGDFAIETIDHFADPRDAQFRATIEGRLILWCLSDLACVDAFGMPNLAPTPKDLGVESFDAELDIGLSVINVRRYAPWNTWLDGPDREHAVIAAGSVLVYKDVKACEAERFRDGCGRWRERGLGLVWPNPPLLAEQYPAKSMPTSLAGPNTEVSNIQPSPDGGGGALSIQEATVLAVLGSRREARAIAADTDSVANAIRERFENAISAVSASGDAIPSASQWSEFAGIVERADVQGLRRVLLGTEQEPGGLCAGDANPEWAGLRPVIGLVIAEATDEAGIAALAKAAWKLRAAHAGARNG